MPIQFASTLLCHSPEIRLLSKEEFGALITRRRGYEFQWADGIVSEDGSETPVHMEGYDPAILDKLVVCDMGEELGLGVFAKSFIAKGTPVLCYSGVMSDKLSAGDLYVLTTNQEKFFSANHRGNLAGFVQHIGEFSPLKHFVDEMTVENLSVEENPDGTLWMIAKRDIHPNEILGYPYDTALETYWAKLHILPKHFDRYGQVLPYVGAIFATQIISIQVYMAIMLNNTDMLGKLRVVYGETIDAALSRITDGIKPFDLLLNVLFFSHIDILRILYPEDRDSLLKIFRDLKPVLDPREFLSGNPYKENRVVKFVEWLDIGPRARLFPPTDRKAALSIPEDFFKIVNPLRYYAFQPHAKAELADLDVYIQRLMNAGLKAYQEKKYADSARKWESSLRLTRDLLTSYWFIDPSTTKLPSVTISRDADKNFVITYDKRISNLSWNLGNAYLNASQIEAPKYKNDYIREAKLCISVAVEIAKASDLSVPDNTALLAKYEERLKSIIELSHGHAASASRATATPR